MSSFSQIIRAGFIDSVKELPSPQSWKVVIMDELSRKVFLSVCQDFDLLSENVTAIETLSAKRAAASDLIGVFFCSPSENNVETIQRDFSPSPKYKSGHIFFLSEPPSEILSQLSSSPSSKYIDKPKVLHINYFPFESRVFTFRNPSSFFDLYSGSSSKSKNEIVHIVNKLLSVCVSLGDNPVVRYQALNSGLHTPQSIALAFQAEMDQYLRSHPKFAVKNRSQSRGVMIILDRSVDLYTPLIHELTYQAMVTDLLGLEEGRIYRHTFTNGLGTEVEEEVLLDETDSIWQSLRHMHIADCIQELVKQFKSTVSDNPAAASMLKRSQNGQNASLKDMRDIVASVPELQELSKKFSAHMDIASKCMDYLRANNLDGVIDCEQNIVTGVTSEGEKVKNILTDMAPLLTEHSIPIDAKLRLLMIYSVSASGSSGDYDRRRLEAHAGLTEADKLALTNFSYLASNKPSVKSKDNTKFLNPFRRSVKPKDEENPYALSRYVPQIKKIIMDQISKEITSEEFPLVKEEESADIKNPVRSLRVNRPTWQKKSGDSSTNSVSSGRTQGGRILVFVAGGLTYSEIRSVYEISKAVGREVVIGTTHIITPPEFLDSLRDFHSHSLPKSPLTPESNSYSKDPVRNPPKTSGSVEPIGPPPRNQSNRASSDRPLKTPDTPTPEDNSSSKAFGFSKFLKFG